MDIAHLIFLFLAIGGRMFPVRTVSILLATVLVIAGSKLIFTR